MTNRMEKLKSNLADLLQEYNADEIMAALSYHLSLSADRVHLMHGDCPNAQRFEYAARRVQLCADNVKSTLDHIRN